MYWAERGVGSYVNDRRLRVSARTKMEDSVFATGIPFKGVRDHDLFSRQLSAVMAVSAGVRRFGSAALDLAYVAAGRFDGFWENGLHPWDVAAGIVLVRESGGLIGEIGGGDDMLHGGSILAANDILYRPLGKLIKDAA